MTRHDATPESFGRTVLGPIVGEFCLRLWSTCSLLERPGDAALLFCARGGLRMLHAHELFGERTGLRTDVPARPLMVSRLAAIRPALVRALDGGALTPAVAATLSYEFRRSTLAGVATAVADTAPTGPGWEAPFTPDGLARALLGPDAGPTREALRTQAALFVEHLDEALDGRGRALLVDTGLYGTTGALLNEGLPGRSFNSLLMARSYRAGTGAPGSVALGLSAEGSGYVPWRRRTALLRYWHFVEWLFEPELPSVRTFVHDGERVRSNLEIDGWRDRIAPAPGTPFAGVVDYLDGLRPGSAPRVLAEADRAWRDYRRAVAGPVEAEAHALAVGERSHDFGSAGTWTPSTGRSALAALRGSSTWREGEIALSRSALRRPLFVALDGAYGVRHLRRALSRR